MTTTEIIFISLLVITWAVVSVVTIIAYYMTKSLNRSLEDLDDIIDAYQELETEHDKLNKQYDELLDYTSNEI